MTTVAHPGSACCDPGQDLAAWIAERRAHTAHLWGQSLLLRQQARQLDREALQALTAGEHRRHADLAAQVRHLSGLANAVAQSAHVIGGDVDRIEAAHAHRLPTTTTQED